MPAQTPSPFSWPIISAFVAQLLPVAAMLLARRSPRTDPLARIAVGFAVLELFDLFELGQLLHILPHQVLAITFSTPVKMLVFTPPLLTLMGPRAKRWQPLVLGATVVLSAVGMLTLGLGREFRVVSNPIADTALSVMALAALFQSAHRSSTDPFRQGVFWVLLGFSVAEAAGILWRPLAEFLVARSWSALVDVHMGMVILQSVTFCMIAYGLLLRPEPVATAPSLTSAPERV